MDDFWSGHDPASKPSDKNHIASPTDRQRACPRRCGATKSSNSERIRFKTDFTARLGEHVSAPSPRSSRVLSALAALLTAGGGAVSRGSPRRSLHALQGLEPALAICDAHRSSPAQNTHGVLQNAVDRP
jgi:hypothetical protein